MQQRAVEKAGRQTGSQAGNQAEQATRSRFRSMGGSLLLSVVTRLFGEKYTPKKPTIKLLLENPTTIKAHKIKTHKEKYPNLQMPTLKNTHTIILT